MTQREIHKSIATQRETEDRCEKYSKLIKEKDKKNLELFKEIKELQVQVQNCTQLNKSLEKQIENQKKLVQLKNIELKQQISRQKELNDKNSDMTQKMIQLNNKIENLQKDVSK